MKKYELIDHTADVGVKAYGSSVSEAFSHAAKAMFDIMTDNSYIDDVGEFNIELDAPDLEQLLVDWLSELLYIHDVDGLVFSRFEISLNNTHLSAKAFGESFNTNKHKIGMEIKAVTYHMLTVQDKPPVFVQVLFDI